METPYPLDWRDDKAIRLALMFEKIRARLGDHPITVLSAYRTLGHNRKIGGSPKSQHLHGLALDLAPPSGWTQIQMYRAIAQSGLVLGLGVYDWGVHVDLRPTAALVTWDLRADNSRAIVV